MELTVKTSISIPKHLKKVQDDTFWKASANEWWKLMQPYIPMQTGALSTTTDIKITDKYKSGKNKGKVKSLSKQKIADIAESNENITGKKGTGTILFTAPYAVRNYNGNFNFRTDKHILASSKWDKAAEPTQKPKLVNFMQKYADSGRLKLDE